MKKDQVTSDLVFFLAAEPGFEPRRTESESAVLPLHNSALFETDIILTHANAFVKRIFEKIPYFVKFRLDGQGRVGRRSGAPSRAVGIGRLRVPIEKVALGCAHKQSLHGVSVPREQGIEIIPTAVHRFVGDDKEEKEEDAEHEARDADGGGQP